MDYVRRRLFPNLVPGALDKFAHLDDTGPLGGGGASSDLDDPSEILCRARILLSARNTGTYICLMYTLNMGKVRQCWDNNKIQGTLQ